jgi:hypothetical protein
MAAKGLDSGAGPRPLGRRLLWFAGLWAAGVAGLAILAGLIRLWLS